jgi:hypothetical protein
MSDKRKHQESIKELRREAARLLRRKGRTTRWVAWVGAAQCRRIIASLRT